jgi:hypothetical protein
MTMHNVGETGGAHVFGNPNMLQRRLFGRSTRVCG